MPKKLSKNTGTTKKISTKAPVKVTMKSSKPKTVAKKEVKLRSKKVVEEVNSNSNENKRTFPIKLNKTQSIVLVLALLLIGLLYQFRSVFVAATVNGQPISRVEIVKNLEKQAGKATLNTLITKTLILQEAKKQNVSVSNEEINKEIKNVENLLSQKGQKLDDLLALQGTTRLEFVDQVRMQKLVEKMIGKDIRVTDKEVDEYIEKNKDLYPEDTDKNQLRTSVKQQLQQEKLTEKFQKWLADLQKKAKITYFVNY